MEGFKMEENIMMINEDEVPNWKANVRPLPKPIEEIEEIDEESLIIKKDEEE